MQAPPARSPAATAPRWTIQRQTIFLRWLLFEGNVAEAAARAGMSRESAYRLRARNRDSLFAHVWNDIASRPPIGRPGTRRAARIPSRFLAGR